MSVGRGGHRDAKTDIGSFDRLRALHGIAQTIPFCASRSLELVVIRLTGVRDLAPRKEGCDDIPRVLQVSSKSLYEKKDKEIETMQRV